MNLIMELQQVIDAFKSNVKTDDVDVFQTQLLGIKDNFKDSAEVASIIKMLQSIGKYLGSQKNNAHKDAVMVLDLIAAHLDELIQTPDAEKEQINKILSHCVQEFNKLKKVITSGPQVSDQEIQDLKSAIFAIDWEISDETLQSLNEMVSRWMEKVKFHKIHYTFLKLINNMGQYLATRKADAHTDSIPFLHSVFEHFEEIIQNPEMPINEKKELLKGDITRFQKFNKKPAPPAKKQVISDDEDEFIQPALSHIISPPSQVSGGIPELSQLSDTESPLYEKSQDTEIITPALTGKKQRISEPRDVMGDLFTIKKTSADDLLDAIHLGNGHENPLAESTNETSEADGIKNFTPQRIDTEPIPEIGNRLDKFFNLDDSENENEPTFFEETNDPDVLDSNDGIIPFEYEDEDEDEISEEIPKHSDLSQEAFQRLKNILEDPGNCLKDTSLQNINEDISHLEELWKDDPDKLFLLETISSLVQFINTSSNPEVMKSDKTSMASPSPPEVPPKGFWKKFKYVFFN